MVSSLAYTLPRADVLDKSCQGRIIDSGRVVGVGYLHPVYLCSAAMRCSCVCDDLQQGASQAPRQDTHHRRHALGSVSVTAAVSREANAELGQSLVRGRSKLAGCEQGSQLCVETE